MLVCRRLLSLTNKRYIHTTPAVLAESDGLFGKLNPWAKKEQPQTVTPAQHTNEEVVAPVTFDVKYEEAEEITSWKRSDVLTNEQEIESTLKSVILQHLQNANETNWKELPFEDSHIKFQILKESIKQTGKEVPNYQLSQLETTGHVLEFFKHTQVQTHSTIEDYFLSNKDSLPTNLTFASRE
ncbi:uncharacterized protein B0P05DRAFT_226750 [Gilbertella persicaria]|uniref:uncharacterized protein n=1 Tax=Gilbertella persicaria TaxID=101096 RepID=UPI00221F8908|nr:uncharacterized protein B0P05DRAFT_226750 [Gilbertella persicaria]KAI8092411.1 hypothetical protein B0P05DRAFT_226750 [Gilbertella persicaria]